LLIKNNVLILTHRNNEIKIKVMNEVIKFEVGNVYEMTYVGDSNLRPKYICVKRTDKSVTFERFQSKDEKITRRVKVWNNSEFVVDGNYSMAPIINASRIIK